MTVSGDVSLSSTLNVSGTISAQSKLNMNNQSVENADHIDTTTLTSSGIITGQSGLSLLGADANTKQNISDANNVDAETVQVGNKTTTTHLEVPRSGTVVLGKDSGGNEPDTIRINAEGQHNVSVSAGTTLIQTGAPDTANRRVFRIDSTGMFVKGPISQEDGAVDFAGALTVGKDTQHANTVLKGSLSVSDAATFESSLAAGSISTSGTLLAHDATTLEDTLTVKKETLLKNSLRVEGTSTLDRQLTISAEGADVTGNSVFQNRLEVKGATTLESGATVNGSALVVNTGHIDTSSTATTLRVADGETSAMRVQRGNSDNTTILAIDTSSTGHQKSR